MFKLLVNAWSWQAAIAAITFCYGINSYMSSFTKAWEDYKDEYGGITFHFIRSLTIKCICITNIILFILCCGSMVITILFIPYFNKTFMTPFYPKEGHPALYWILLYYVFHYFTAFMWLQPTVLLCCIVMMLRNEFLIFNQDFKRDLAAKILCPETNGTRSTVEDFRLRYETLCRVVCRFDNLICSFNFTVYAFDIPMLCFFVYVLFNSGELYNNEALPIASSIAAFFVALMHLVFVTVTSASLQMAVSIKGAKF